MSGEVIGCMVTLRMRTELVSAVCSKAGTNAQKATARNRAIFIIESPPVSESILFHRCPALDAPYRNLDSRSIFAPALFSFAGTRGVSPDPYRDRNIGGRRSRPSVPLKNCRADPYPAGPGPLIYPLRLSPLCR